MLKDQGSLSSKKGQKNSRRLSNSKTIFSDFTAQQSGPVPIIIPEQPYKSYAYPSRAAFIATQILCHDDIYITQKHFVRYS